MALTEILKKLSKAKENTQQAYASYAEARDAMELIKDELTAELKSQGLKSAKTDDFVASIVDKTSIQINHEASVIDWLKHQPDLEPDLYIGVKKQAFEPMAKLMLKNTGEVIPGTDIKTSEYLAVRKVKK